MQQNAPFVIRKAQYEEARAIATLAARTYYDTFVEHTAPDDMERFLAATYNEAQQQRELEDENITTLVVDTGGERASAIVAYAQVRRGGEVPECVDGTKPIELARFYIDRPWHGRGVAQALMRAVEAVAATYDAQTLWLGVWERNFRAIAFYTKCSFRKVGAHPFLVGSDVQSDDVMSRAL